MPALNFNLTEGSLYRSPLRLMEDITRLSDRSREKRRSHDVGYHHAKRHPDRDPMPDSVPDPQAYMDGYQKAKSPAAPNDAVRRSSVVPNSTPSAAVRQSAKTVNAIGAPAASVARLKPPWLQRYWDDRKTAREMGQQDPYAASFNQAIDTASNQLRGSHGIKLGKRLGGGTSGATYVHSNSPGTIVKFDKGDREARLARHTSRKGLKQVSVLPNYHQVINTGVKDAATGDTVYALHREDIPDLRTKNHVPWHHYGRAVSDTAERLAASGEPSHDYHSLRQELDDHAAKWKDEIHPSERQQFDRFHKGMQQLLRHGIIPCDVHAGNLGTRANGEMVVRDAGCHHRVQFQ